MPNNHDTETVGTQPVAQYSLGPPTVSGAASSSSAAAAAAGAAASYLREPCC
jgi:hypothetical protein